MPHLRSRGGVARTPGLAARIAAVPRYRWIQLTILLVLVVAFVTSFSSGSEGAHRSGYREEFSSAFPLICDVVAMLATVMHGWARHDQQMRRVAVGFVMAPMLLSWVANAVDHLDNAGITAFGATEIEKVWTVWVVLAAGLCPVAVAALLYLAAKFVEFEKRQAAKPQPAAPIPAEIEKIADDEPEFIEPRPVISSVAAPVAAALHAVPDVAPAAAAETDFETAVEEMLQAHRKPGMYISREVAEAMVRGNVKNRSAWFRLSKERRDALLA